MVSIGIKQGLGVKFEFIDGQLFCLADLVEVDLIWCLPQICHLPQIHHTTSHSFI